MRPVVFWRLVLVVVIGIGVFYLRRVALRSGEAAGK